MYFSIKPQSKAAFFSKEKGAKAPFFITSLFFEAKFSTKSQENRVHWYAHR